MRVCVHYVCVCEGVQYVCVCVCVCVRTMCVCESVQYVCVCALCVCVKRKRRWWGLEVCETLDKEPSLFLCHPRISGIPALHKVSSVQPARHTPLRTLQCVFVCVSVSV